LIRFVAETGSTNADLLAAGDAAGEGTWLVARRQSAGRGRLGRAWNDGAGNFMGSTVVRLWPSDPPAQTLALAAGLAAHQAVAALPGAPGELLLKWPNDLRVGVAKLGGILLERHGERVVIGIGINLAQAPALPDRPTAAFADFAPAPTVEDFAALLAARLALVLGRWHGGDWPGLRHEWLAHAHPAGTALELRDGDRRPIAGTFAGLGEDGAAHLRLADGGTRAIHAGDVELVAMSGAGDAAGD
jgi:BirA family transcriptional regulator, biotin operon repressor / biotin---[acetyl-CoA-carboxylase] ligase